MDFPYQLATFFFKSKTAKLVVGIHGFDEYGKTKVNSYKKQAVRDNRQNEKNDVNDAEAICETVTRAKTRFLSIKSEEQQAVLCLHHIRQGQIKDRTVMINRLRRLLSEFGIIIPDTGEVTAHTFRHSIATSVLKGGADIRILPEMLDFRVIKTTQTYIHTAGLHQPGSISHFDK